MRTPMGAPLTHNPAHSLQVGSHLPLQHRNSFCVSALSSPSAGSSLYAPQSYASSGHFAGPDPFAFATHRAPFEDAACSEVPFSMLATSVTHGLTRVSLAFSRSPAGSGSSEPGPLRWPTAACSGRSATRPRWTWTTVSSRCASAWRSTLSRAPTTIRRLSSGVAASGCCGPFYCPRAQRCSISLSRCPTNSAVRRRLSCLAFTSSRRIDLLVPFPRLQTFLS